MHHKKVNFLNIILFLYNFSPPCPSTQHITIFRLRSCRTHSQGPFYVMCISCAFTLIRRQRQTLSDLCHDLPAIRTTMNATAKATKNSPATVAILCSIPCSLNPMPGTEEAQGSITLSFCNSLVVVRSELKVCAPLKSEITRVVSNELGAQCPTSVG